MIIPNHFDFAILFLTPRNTKNNIYFSIDQNIEFCSYVSDSYPEPPSILQVLKFCRYVENLLQSHEEKLTFFTSHYSSQKTTSLFYCLCFKLISLSMTVTEYILYLLI